MSKQYTTEELNRILLNKKVKDFYFAVLENRPGKLISNKEYNKIKTNGSDYDDQTKKVIDSVEDIINNDEKAAVYKDDIMRAFFSAATIRQSAILTFIDGKVYDIANMCFIDLTERKVVMYERIDLKYTDETARVKIFTHEDEPLLTEDTALLDVDDETPFSDFIVKNMNREYREDLSDKFLSENK